MDQYRTPPTIVTTITIFVLSITLWNTVRLFVAIRYWKLLSEFGGNPEYIALTALVWVFLGVWFVRIFVGQRRNAVRIGYIFAIFYYSWYWIDWLFIQHSPAPNLLFSFISSTTLLIIFSIIMGIPSAKSFLNKE